MYIKSQSTPKWVDDITSGVEEYYASIPEEVEGDSMSDVFAKLDTLSKNHLSLDITCWGLDDLVHICELANWSAKNVDYGYYEVKDYLIDFIVTNYPQVCSVDTSWGIPCIHVEAPAYGVTCYHTPGMDWGGKLDNLPDGEWNLVGRQDFAPYWGKLSAGTRQIVAEVSRRNPIAIQKLLVLQKTNPSLRYIKVFIDQDNQDDDDDY